MRCSRKEDLMLSVKDINYQLGKKEILRDISLSFLPGEINMILGPNGSGKSTLLKILGGELQGYKGEVLYDGVGIKRMSKEAMAKQRAVMSQQPELSFPLTVDEVVMMGRYPHFGFQPTKKDHAICDEVMERMNICTLKDRNYLTLSGGEKQRVQFARVLSQIWETPATGYRYLLLDEPLTNLDINYQQTFLQMAREFTQEQTVLVAVVHDINLAIQYGGKLFFLKEGSLIAHGLLKEIITTDLIKKVFDVNTVVINNPVNNKPLVVYANE
jgi:iron complex transport system ATP-binding protein